MNDFSSIRNLITSTNKGITPSYVAHSSIIVLNQKCIRNNGIDFSLAQFHDENKKFSSSKIVKIGDILINSTGQGTAGRCAFIKSLPDNFTVIVDSHILIVRIKDFYTAGCVELNLYSIESWLQTFMDGSTGQGEFDKERLFNIQLKLPPKSQRQIVFNLINSFEKKLELNNRINTELETMVKTIYDYWFVQFEFPDKNGKPYKSSGGKMVYNETLKRQIPDKWCTKTLSKIAPISCQNVTPRGFPNKLFKHFSIPAYDAIKSYYIEPGNAIASNKFTALNSDILVSKLNPWFNRVVYVIEDGDQICSTEFVVWRTPKQSVKNYLYMIAISRPFIEYCTLSATGTSNSHKRVNPKQMMQFPVPFDTSVVDYFGEKVEPILKKIFINQQENIKLIKFRDWLLPILMNGQVTIK